MNLICGVDSEGDGPESVVLDASCARCASVQTSIQTNVISITISKTSLGSGEAGLDPVAMPYEYQAPMARPVMSRRTAFTLVGS